EAAEAATREAESLGAHPGWVRMLHGQIELNRGHPRRAIQELEQAVRLMPDSVAARAMLLWAVIFSGESQTYQDDEALERLTPVTPDDFLYKGQVESMWDPALALRTLDEAVSRRNSGVARLIRAWALGRLASSTGDLEAAERAVRDADFARAMVGDTPYALV